MNGAATFRLIDDPERPVRVIQVGAGGMGQSWLQTLDASADAELVGIVDLNEEAARSAAERFVRASESYGDELAELIDRVRPDAVIDVTIPAAHHSVTATALFLGVPVLGEKPAAVTVAEALSLQAISHLTGELFMVSQSRRYDQNLAALHGAITELGGAGFLTGEHFKAPRFGGFREQMEHPFLLDMAIHAFDMARFLLDADPIAVYCEEFNPAGSWYTGAAATSVLFEMDEAKRFAYQGSWCAPGLETSWNGRWRASGRGGSAVWDGDGAPIVELVPPRTASATGLVPIEGIAGALAEFISVLRGQSTPSTDIAANIPSLAMVEASVQSAQTGERVRIDDLMNAARETASANEENPDIIRSLRELATTEP